MEQRKHKSSDSGEWMNVMESSPAFPTTLAAGKRNERVRWKLHEKRVDKKYDLIGPTLMQKKEFDVIREKQQEWMENAKSTRSLEIAETESKDPEVEDPDGDEESVVRLLKRQESKLPFLIEPSMDEVVWRRKDEFSRGTKRSRQASLCLGVSTHHRDIQASLQRKDKSRKRKRESHYKVLEFMSNRLEFEHYCHANAACKSGTQAVIKCFSCIKYDPLMEGLYCESCFKVRHPDYRTQHNWSYLDGSIDPPKQKWSKHMHRLDTERRILQYKAVLDEIKTIETRTNEAKVEEKTFDRINIGKKQVNYVDDTIYHLKKKLPKSYTRAEAASIVQRVWRSRVGKRAFIKMLKRSYEYRFDQETEQWYYLNLVNGSVSLERPKLLDLYDPVKFLTKDTAARRIQGMYRTKVARGQIRVLLQLCVERHVDKKTGKVYYYNIRTKKTSWQKPTFLANVDVLTPRTRRAKARIQEKKDLGLFKSADSMTEEQAASLIQSIYRVKKCRRRIEAIMLQRIRKVTDQKTGKVYYYNLTTGQVSWVPPSSVKESTIAEYKPGEKAKKVYHTKEEAATALQGMYRAKKARERLRALLSCSVEKYRDENTGQYYFYNVRTKQTMWSLPAGMDEEEILSPMSRERKERLLRKKAEGRFKSAETLTELEASLMIQSAWKCFKARKDMAEILLQTMRKIIDPETNEVYFFSILTKKTFWEKPSMLRSVETSRIPDFQEEDYFKEKKKKKKKRVFHSEEEAASALQGMYRLRKARIRIRELLLCTYEKYYDPATEKHYYLSLSTGVISWTVPTVLEGCEILTPRSRRRKAHAQKRKDRGVFKTVDSLNNDEAARMIQGMWMTWKARQGVANVLLESIRKITNNDDGSVYFYSVKTKKTFWEKPSLLRHVSLSKIAEFNDVEEEERKKKLKKKREKRTFRTPDEAASALQGMYRTKKARERLRALISCQVEKYQDQETGQYYYYNVKTGTTMWTLPAGVGQEEVLTPVSRERRERLLWKKEAGKFKYAADLDDDQASRMIQSAFRAYKARQQMAAILLQTLRKITDPETGRLYFISITTQKAFWRKPMLLRDTTLSKILEYDAQRDVRKRTPRIYSSDEEAAIALQQMYRRKVARDRVRDMLLGCFERHVDKNDGTVFYYNTRTGESIWAPPTLLDGVEILTPRARKRKELALRKKMEGKFKSAKDLSEEDAVLMIQRQFRANRARNKIRALLAASICKAMDENGNVYYIFGNNQATYVKPQLLRDLSDSKIEYFETKQAQSKKKKSIKSAGELGNDEAALMIQRRFRANKCRVKLREALLAGLQKARDENGQVYYILGQEKATYYKPVLLRDLSDSKIASFKYEAKPETTTKKTKKELVVLGEDEAATMVQRRFRANRCREKLRQVLLQKVSKAYDENGNVYYIIGHDQATYMKPSLLKNLSNSNIVNFGEMTPDQAAFKLQGMYRRKKARERMRGLFLACIEKHHADDGREYYYNTLTGASSWVPPSVLKMEDVLTPRSRERKALVEEKKKQGLFKYAASITLEEAAVMIQRRYRAMQCRGKLRDALINMVTKARDNEGQVYYVIGNSNATYVKPMLLRDLSDSKILTYGKLPTTNLTPDEAASKLQGMYRAKKARERMRNLLMLCIEKHCDENGYEYYFNTVTGESHWEKPKLLTEVDVLTPRTRQRKQLVAKKKEAGRFKSCETMTPNEAAILVQGMWRTRKARHYLREMAKAVYTKIFDPETQSYYFYNTKTGESSWEQPF